MTIEILFEEERINDKWKKIGIYTTVESDDLKKAPFHCTLKLKRKIKEHQKEFENISDDLKIEELLKIHSHLKEMEINISKELGLVLTERYHN